MSGCGQMNQEDVPYSIQKEFAIIDYLKKSCYETRGVDAFCLALLKMERQMRRLFTYLVFQSEAFSKEDVKKLKKILANNKGMYFEHFMKGVDDLLSGLGLNVEILVGMEYSALVSNHKKIKRLRNKIFHGQITGEFVGRKKLFGYVDDMKKWCICLCRGADDKLGYDGFGYVGNKRNPSFFKEENGKLPETVKRTINEKFGGDNAFRCYKEFLDELAPKKNKISRVE